VTENFLLFFKKKTKIKTKRGKWNKQITKGMKRNTSRVVSNL